MPAGAALLNRTDLLRRRIHDDDAGPSVRIRRSPLDTAVVRLSLITLIRLLPKKPVRRRRRDKSTLSYVGRARGMQRHRARGDSSDADRRFSLTRSLEARRWPPSFGGRSRSLAESAHARPWSAGSTPNLFELIASHFRASVRETERTGHLPSGASTNTLGSVRVRRLKPTATLVRTPPQRQKLAAVGKCRARPERPTSKAPTSQVLEHGELSFLVVRAKLK